MLDKRRLTPWLMLAGIIFVLGIISRTDLLNPVMHFIHSDQGTTWQLALCVAAAIAGLRAAYVLLNVICRYYSGLFDKRIMEQSRSREKINKEVPLS